MGPRQETHHGDGFGETFLFGKKRERNYCPSGGQGRKGEAEREYPPEAVNVVSATISALSAVGIEMQSALEDKTGLAGQGRMRLKAMPLNADSFKICQRDGFPPSYGSSISVLLSDRQDNRFLFSRSLEKPVYISSGGGELSVYAAHSTPNSLLGYETASAIDDLRVALNEDNGCFFCLEKEMQDTAGGQRRWGHVSSRLTEENLLNLALGRKTLPPVLSPLCWQAVLCRFLGETSIKWCDWGAIWKIDLVSAGITSYFDVPKSGPDNAGVITTGGERLVLKTLEKKKYGLMIEGKTGELEELGWRCDFSGGNGITGPTLSFRLAETREELLTVRQEGEGGLAFSSPAYMGDLLVIPEEDGEIAIKREVSGEDMGSTMDTITDDGYIYAMLHAGWNLPDTGIIIRQEGETVGFCVEPRRYFPGITVMGISPAVIGSSGEAFRRFIQGSQLFEQAMLGGGL